MLPGGEMLKRFVRGRLPLFILALLGFQIFFAGCASRKQAAPAPPAEYQALVSEGDAYFAKAHLWGWRKALAAYKAARALFVDENLNSKLVLTAALVATREHDEGIRDTRSESEIEAWARPGNPRDQFLLRLTRQYSKGGTLPAGVLPSEPEVEALLHVEGDALDAYLYVLYLKVANPEKLKAADATLSEMYKNSPLFLYRGTVEDPDKAQSEHPEFAELTFFAGEIAFSNQVVGKARQAFARTVELLPDHTGAINGLGDIHFFNLQDYAKAMQFYEQAHAIDRTNVKAVFGKGAALHYLGKFTDSTLTMDTLLNSKEADWGRLNPAQSDYYRGEAYYYMAYNHYLLDNNAEARRLIDTAKTYLPKSAGISFLSGLMHYKGGRNPNAKTDFTTVLLEATSYCEAPYYLGLIDTAEGGAVAPGYFLSSAECLTKTVKKMEDGRKAIPRMDITAEEKASLEEKARTGIQAFRKSSVDMLDRMIRLTEPAASGDEPTSTRAVLEAVRAEMGQTPERSAGASIPAGK